MRGLLANPAALRRGAMLTAIWLLALLQLGRAAVTTINYFELRRDVASLDAQYQARLQDYSGLLAEGERIRHDTQYQIGLLKRNYGYTEPDETPIIVRVAK